MILFGNVDVLLERGAAVPTIAWGICFEGIASFVVFPSPLSFYPDSSMLCADHTFSYVVSIRRREDAERNRDTGVEVQIDGSCRSPTLDCVSRTVAGDNSEGRRERKTSYYSRRDLSETTWSNFELEKPDPDSYVLKEREKESEGMGW